MKLNDMEAAQNQLKKISINEMKDYQFIIPSYQRFYKWRKEHVKQLLDDIYRSEEEYFLQPLVVKNENKYTLIDGQQRLTTIYLITEYLNRKENEKDKEKIFTIEYERRQENNQSDYIDSILNKCDTKNYNTIDEYYICNAYGAIEEWFNNDENKKNKIREKLNEVYFLWYEVNNDDNPIEIFNRINQGKIPLTDAEMVKALLLHYLEEESKKIAFANDWDYIEKELQDDKFWFFFADDNMNYKNRIEFILDIIAGNDYNKERFETFNYFYEKLTPQNGNSKEEPQKIWNAIKKNFYILQEIYKDFELYHYIGFLLCTEKKDIIKDIKNIIHEYNNKKDKKELLQWIIEQIKNVTKNVTKDATSLDSLRYYENSEIIKKILLLFNIQSHIEIQNPDFKFPFDKYKKERWSLEHIYPQTPENFNKNEFVKWFKDYKDDIIMRFEEKDRDNIKKIFEQISNKNDKNDKIEVENAILDEFLKEFMTKYNEGKYDELYNLISNFLNYGKIQIDKQNNIEPEDIDNISNLVLLDSGLNSSLNNDFFFKKREKIIEAEKNGEFIPITTRLAFLKYYSPKTTNFMIWTEEDAKFYLNQIKETLKDFIR